MGERQNSMVHDLGEELFSALTDDELFARRVWAVFDDDSIVKAAEKTPAKGEEAVRQAVIARLLLENSVGMEPILLLHRLQAEVPFPERFEDVA